MDPKPTEEKPISLAAKLCRVIANSGYVKKLGTNQKQGYKYATEADVLAEIRQELAKVNVFIFPSVMEQVRTLHGKTSGGYDNFITDVIVKWTFVDGDSGETRECIMPGCGIDTGDKGLYKAITGSSKYMFIKGFMLPTGDDPEEEKLTKEDIEDGKRAATTVGLSKLGKIPPVELVPWKANTVCIKGDGAPIIKTTMTAAEKAKFMIVYDDDAKGYKIPASQARSFASICEKYKVPCKFVESRTNQDILEDKYQADLSDDRP